MPLTTSAFCRALFSFRKLHEITVPENKANPGWQGQVSQGSITNQGNSHIPSIRPPGLTLGSSSRSRLCRGHRLLWEGAGWGRSAALSGSAPLPSAAWPGESGSAWGDTQEQAPAPKIKIFPLKTTSEAFLAFHSTVQFTVLQIFVWTPTPTLQFWGYNYIENKNWGQYLSKELFMVVLCKSFWSPGIVHTGDTRTRNSTCQ